MSVISTGLVHLCNGFWVGFLTGGVESLDPNHLEDCSETEQMSVFLQGNNGFLIRVNAFEILIFARSDGSLTRGR